MRPRSLPVCIAVLLAAAPVAHGEDYGPLGTVISSGCLLSVALGIGSAAWFATHSRRRWIWLLIPVFVLAWAFLLGVAFFALTAILDAIDG